MTELHASEVLSCRILKHSYISILTCVGKTPTNQQICLYCHMWFKSLRDLVNSRHQECKFLRTDGLHKVIIWGVNQWKNLYSYFLGQNTQASWEIGVLPLFPCNMIFSSKSDFASFLIILIPAILQKIWKTFWVAFELQPWCSPSHGTSSCECNMYK